TATGLSNNTSYYWRVNAANSGGTSSWSTIWSFTTVVAAPSPPILKSPADLATGISTTPTLVWNAASGAASYEIPVSANSSFTPTIIDQSGMTVDSNSAT